MKRKKNTISWLFNQKDAQDAIKSIGARNLTVVKAVKITSTEETEIKSYDKMVMCQNQEADEKLKLWMLATIKNYEGEEYIYFRFIRTN